MVDEISSSKFTFSSQANKVPEYFNKASRFVLKNNLNSPEVGLVKKLLPLMIGFNKKYQDIKENYSYYKKEFKNNFSSSSTVKNQENVADKINELGSVHKMQNNELSLEPEMSPKEIHKALDNLNIINVNTNIKDFDVIVNKYGTKITNPNYLLAQINTIEDKHLRNSALNKLAQFQVKVLGLEFGIGGEFEIKNKKSNSFIKWIDHKIFGSTRTVPIDGYERAKSHAKVANSVENFSLAHPKLTEEIGRDDVEKVIEALNKSAKYTIASKTIDTQAKEILEDIRKGNPVTIPTGWAGHAVEVTIYKGLLCYTDRGGGVDPKLRVYQLDTNNIDKAFIKKLLSKDTLITKERSNWFESKNGMIKDLGAIEFGRFQADSQEIGNCTMVSAQSGAEALLLLLKLDGKVQTFFENRQKFVNYKNTLSKNSKEWTEEETRNVDELSQKMRNSKSVATSSHKDVKKFMQNCEFETRKEEFKFFVQMINNIKNSDRAGKIFSEATEFQILSEMCNKFYNVNYRQKIEEFDQKAMNNLDDILANFSFSHYQVENCIVDLRKQKDVEKYLDKLMEPALPGAFIIFKDGNEVFVEVKNGEDRIRKKVDVNEIKDISSLKNHLDLDMKYPIVNYAQI